MMEHNFWKINATWVNGFSEKLVTNKRKMNKITTALSKPNQTYLHEFFSPMTKKIWFIKSSHLYMVF